VKGHLDSQKNATLSSKVEGSTTIISIVPEGTWVEEGDVVCELDSAELREKAKQQEITVTQAEAAMAQAVEAVAIQKKQNESDLAAAELKKKLAKLDLEKYKQGEYPQQLKQLSGSVALAEEELLRNEETFSFTREQVQKGYRTQNDLEAARIAVKQGKLKLQGSQEELKVLTEFTYIRQIAELDANAIELNLELERVKLKAQSALTQFEKDVEARKLTYEVEKERHDRQIEQIAACSLIAPQSGEVVYANLGSSYRSSEGASIEEGAQVRERQAIINLPDVTKMKVDCRIHESMIGEMRAGLPARIRIDAYPDQVFLGSVESVSSVPMTGRFPNTDLREYESQIHLTDSVEKIRKLRPGLTAQVEILIDNREDILQVPIQAVVSIGPKQVSYVAKNNGTVERRDVKIGQSNQTHIEIIKGIEDGEIVILNPRSRFASEISELEAAMSLEEAENEAKKPKRMPVGGAAVPAAPKAQKPGKPNPADNKPRPQSKKPSGRPTK